jgi:hypothetical protein
MKKRDTGQPRRWPIGVAAATSLALLAGYTFVSATFTLPASPAQAAVQDGFAPYFSQRWDVFAPHMLKVNSSMEIQVQWREDGELVHSSWVDVTGMELGAVDGTLTPSRISKNTVNAITTYLSRYDELSDDQQVRVQDTFVERTGDGEFGPIPDEELIAEIDDLGDDASSESDVIRFIRYDYMLTRFAAAFGEAYFGHDIERVRWRADFSRPNDFEHRNQAERQTEPSHLEFGWRQPSEANDPAVVDVFSDVIDRYTQR